MGQCGRPQQPVGLRAAGSADKRVEFALSYMRTPCPRRPAPAAGVPIQVAHRRTPSTLAGESHRNRSHRRSPLSHGGHSGTLPTKRDWRSASCLGETHAPSAPTRTWEARVEVVPGPFPAHRKNCSSLTSILVTRSTKFVSPANLTRWRRTGWLGRRDSNLCISKSDLLKFIRLNGI
jgi:hypothetical protein